MTDSEATNSEDIYGEGFEHPSVQSVLFRKPLWNSDSAVRWLRRHEFTHFDVDEKPDHLRFRQIEPEDSFRYITKTIDNGVQFIIITNLHKGMGIHKDIDMSDTSDSESEIIRDLDRIGHRIHKHHQAKGGKLNIVKSFKKLGHTIKDSFTKKGGVTSGLIHTGIPMVTGALAEAAVPEAGPLSGMAGEYAGSKLADYVGKKTGYGLGGDLVHIDVASHNGGGTGEGLRKRRGRKKFTEPRNMSLDQLKEAHDEKVEKELRDRSLKIVKALTGGGVKFKKGSPEAKEHMAKLRAMRSKI